MVKQKYTNNKQMVMNYLRSPIYGRKKILKEICVINALPHGLVSLTLLKRMRQLRALVVRFQIPNSLIHVLNPVISIEVMVFQMEYNVSCILNSWMVL